MRRTDAALIPAKSNVLTASGVYKNSPNQTQTLSEHASKRLLADYGLCVTHEILADNPQAAAEAAAQIGFPVVVKLCGDSKHGLPFGDE